MTTGMWIAVGIVTLIFVCIVIYSLCATASDSNDVANDIYNNVIKK